MPLSENIPNTDVLEPTLYLKRLLKESEQEIKEEYVSPAFDNSEDLDDWLEDPNAHYANGQKLRG